MDSLTHIALGAVLGEACTGKSLGKKSLLLGAAFQSIPDIDFIASFFLSPTDNLLAHRGITHSLLFSLLITILLSFMLAKWKQLLSFKQWMIFIGIEVFVHLLLDACNAYGVGWFEPFSQVRISFNIIFVADPLFSFGVGIAAIALWLLPSAHVHRSKLIVASLAICTIYLCTCVVNKIFVNHKFEETLHRKNINYSRSFTTPTAFNNLLWYCVAENDSGYYIGYRSIFDTSEEINLTYFHRQRWLLDSIEEEEEMGNLLRFSNGYYTVETDYNSIVFNDLRFGRIAGWEKPNTNFAFRYYLQQPGKNVLVVQRGRFAEWNQETMLSLLERIKGN